MPAPLPPPHQPVQHTLCLSCKLSMCNSSKCVILVPRSSLLFLWILNNICVGLAHWHRINTKFASHVPSLLASVEGTTVCLEIPPPPRRPALGDRPPPPPGRLSRANPGVCKGGGGQGTPGGVRVPSHAGGYYSRGRGGGTWAFFNNSAPLGGGGFPHPTPPPLDPPTPPPLEISGQTFLRAFG